MMMEMTNDNIGRLMKVSTMVNKMMNYEEGWHPHFHEWLLI